MLSRLNEKVVRERLSVYPAVALTGPRQCGKTTLARSIRGAYFDLEIESERLRLDLEWNALLPGRELIVLDEAQSWPEIFPRLRGAIDSERRRARRFLLLGSVSPSLMTNVSESLAGRLSLVELTPFLFSELDSETTRGRHWLCGGYPDGGVLSPARYPRWQSDYLTLLVQRDLPTWGLPAKPQVTNRLLRMLAACNGQVWNAVQIGQSMGLSYHTINNYLDYLVGAFLVRLLPPYQANVRKRLVKRPKLYWRDSGLAHALLNVADGKALLEQPWVGFSWEGYVIEQVLGELSAADRMFEAYYFRTSDNREIDLVLDFGGELWAVEIKLTSYPSTEDIGRLEKAADIIGASRRFLVSRTRENVENDRCVSCGLAEFLDYARSAAP